MKSRPLVGILLACCIAAPLAGFQQGAMPHGPDDIPQLPTPSGPFGIGRIGYHWTDNSRPDEYGQNLHRELMAYFWYPTAKSVGTKGQYFAGASQMNAMPEVQRAMRGEFGDRWDQIVSGAIFSHAIDNAPVAKSRTRFPVVTFSHGLGSTGFNYTVVIEDLVSHGYVVAAIEHPYSAMAVLFPDGRVLQFHKNSPPAGLSTDERMKWTMEQISKGINEGAADVRFVIDRITQLDHNKQQFALAGAVDLNRIAAAGHSAGAEFAARACQQDPRIRACVDLDGGMVPVAALPVYTDNPMMRQPLLFLEAYHPDSKMGGTPEQIAEYKRVREQQLKELRRGSYAVVLHSPEIAHPSFSDVPLLLHGREGFPETPVVLHNLDLITRFVRGFLDTTLREEESPLFDGRSSPVPEALVKAYGH